MKQVGLRGGTVSRLGRVLRLVAGIVAIAHPADAACPAKPNIVIFVADDLAWVHLPFDTTPAKWTNDDPMDSAETSPPGRISRLPRTLISPTLNRLDARLFADRTSGALFSLYTPPGPDVVSSYPVKPVDVATLTTGSYTLNECDGYPLCDPEKDILHGHGGLKRLADAGMVFTRFYATSVVCSPTRASLMTGRHGWKTGATGLREKEKLKSPGVDRTIASYLKQYTCPGADCYRTGLIGKWHVTTEDPEDIASTLGFDEVIADNKAKRGDFSHKVMGCFPANLNLDATTFDPPGTPLPGSNLGLCNAEQQSFVEGGRSFCTDDISPAQSGQCNFGVRLYGDLAENFIDRHNEENFFLVVALNAVHDPHSAPLRTAAHYTTDGPEGGREKGNRARGGGKFYWAQIEEMDATIGRVLDRLDAWGLTDDTLVLFTADQGQDGFEAPWGEPQLAGFKTQALEGGIRVPFMASACGDTCDPETEDCRTDRVASHVDLMRTIAEAAGIEANLPASGASNEVEGRSLWTALNSQNAAAGTPRDFAFAAEELKVTDTNGKRVAVTTREGYATAATFFNADDLSDPNNAPNGICGYEGPPISDTTQHRLRGASCIGCTPGDPDALHAGCGASTCVILGGRCIADPMQPIPSDAPRCNDQGDCVALGLSCYTDLTVPCNRCRPPAWKLYAEVNGSAPPVVSKTIGLYDLEGNPEEQDIGDATSPLDLDCEEEFAKVKDELACTLNKWIANNGAVPLENGKLDSFVVLTGHGCSD